MSWILGFYRSTVGKKVIMGVTGIIGIGYLLLHMAGNLQVFLGPEKINGYARLLHGPAAELLWLAAMIVTGLHLYHGAWSVLRTLGIKKLSGNPFQRRLATGLAVLIWLGFTVVPLAIWAGAVRPQPAASRATAAPAISN